MFLHLLALNLAAFPNQTPSGSTTLRSAAQQHRLLIGTAVEPRFFSEPDYSRILGTEFSSVEPENNMKFSSIHPRPDTDPNPYDFSGADELVAFAQAHRMKVRGHCLVWHNQVSRWIFDPSLTPGQRAEALHKHIETVVGRYRGKVFAWDVVNEAFLDDGKLRHTVWFDRPGIGLADQGTKYMEQAFEWARRADPRAKLFYNDYGAETLDPKSDGIYAMLKDFRSRHVPVDGIGFQMHIDPSFDRPEALDSFRKNLQRFASLGLEIHITEMDVSIRNDNPESLAAQAKAYADVAKVCLEQPRCKLFQIWGFTDRHSWLARSRPLLWDADYKPKPAYFTLVETLRGK